MASDTAEAKWVSEDGLSWRPLAPFGVEVDADFSTPLAKPAADRFYRLLDENGLIVARGQLLTMEQQKALLEPIGPDLHRAHANDTGYITTDGPDPVLAELSFHSDNAYTDQPFAAISLHAIDVVDGASSTRFVDAARAYETLSPGLRQRFEGLSAEMIKPAGDHIGVRVCDVDDPQASFAETFDAVRVNRRTGRRFLAPSEMQTSRLTGMDRNESRALLHQLYDHLYAPENIHEHRWRVGDIVIWDNVSLQHARGPLSEVGRRVLQRVVACL